MQPLVPVPVLINLKCGQCRKFVTCGPVHVTPDSRMLCGRCKHVSKNFYRNIAFEAIGCIYRYPCHYWPKHCNKKLAWNEALDHENKCIFQSSCNVFCSKPGTFFKSERKLPNNSEINLEHVPDDVLEKLKCLVCENYLSNEPVHITVDGKNICHRCCHSNGIPKGAIRNLGYEALASALIFPCIYRYRGCAIRLKFGREMWTHENECPYGQVSKRLSKKPSKVISKDGKEKERGVIQTHSGHIWGTITPHSALFAPPKAKNNEGKMVTQELTEVMKKKNEESKNFDAQSVDSVVSKASTFDSLGDNISRSTGDNISRDNISRSTIDNVSRDNVSRSSSRLLYRDNLRHSSETTLNEEPKFSPGYSKDQMRLVGYEKHESFRVGKTTDQMNFNSEQYLEEILPIPAPPGYNKAHYNVPYQENLARYSRPSHYDANAHLYHYPPIYYDNNTNYHTNFNNMPTHVPHVTPTRNESFRIGNQELIDELKVRQHKKHSGTSRDSNPYGQYNNLQEIVQEHEQGFS